MPPAARIGDMHTCPMVTPGTPPIPHVGGPISVGFPMVLIGGMPAARAMDMAICVGPPDSIAKGSMTVMIGSMPAARMGDNTMHGGVIVMGCPTVMIGDVGMGGGGGGGGPADAFGVGAVLVIAALGVVAVVATVDALSTETYSKGITIKGSKEFRKKTRESLDRLKATPTGETLLEDIGKSGKSVKISETSKMNGTCRPKNVAKANRKSDGSANKGSDSDVRFNPDFRPGGLANEVVLGHELMHAQHNARGTRETGKTSGTKNEELKTVGLPPYPENGVTENSLRNDLGVSKRTSY